MAKCKSCGAEIIWKKTSRGKAMPCDPERITIITMNSGQVLQGYIPHWENCPGAKKHREKAKRKKVQQQKLDMPY